MGSVITFRYQELSDRGVPRFPSFVGIRQDEQPSPIIAKGQPTMSPTPTESGVRRFEFSEGTSNKFWQISRNGNDVTVCFGRMGTKGQAKTNTFPDEAAAASHVEKLILEKTAKGYRELA